MSRLHHQYPFSFILAEWADKALNLNSHDSVLPALRSIDGWVMLVSMIEARLKAVCPKSVM